ncbi:MAG: hypothetical protein WC980_00245 [Candidatus Brocadiia bacterium]
MTEREKADVYLKLCEIQISLFHKRVDVEWRFFLAFLGAIVALTGYLAPRSDVEGYFFLIYSIVASLWILCLYWFWVADEKDKRHAWFYRENAAKLVDSTIKVKEFADPKVTEFIKHWSTGLRIIITVISLGLSLWVIHIV